MPEPKKVEPKQVKKKVVEEVKCKCGAVCTDLNYKSSRRAFCPKCAKERLYFDALTGKVRHRYKAELSPNGLLKPSGQTWASPLEVPVHVNAKGVVKLLKGSINDLLKDADKYVGIHGSVVNKGCIAGVTTGVTALRKAKAALNLVKRLQTVDLEKPSNIPLVTKSMFAFLGGEPASIGCYVASIDSHAINGLTNACKGLRVERPEGPGGLCSFMPLIIADKDAVVEVYIMSMTKQAVLRTKPAWKASQTKCHFTGASLPASSCKVMVGGTRRSVCAKWLAPRIKSGEYVPDGGGTWVLSTKIPPELEAVLPQGDDGGCTVSNRIARAGFCSDFDGVKELNGVGRTLSVEVECNPTMVSMVNLYHWGIHGAHLVTRHRDGSLRGENAAEYVSPILYESNYVKWVEELCERLDAVIYRQCGLHVWVGTHDYTSANLSALAQWCAVNQDRFAEMVTPDRTHNWQDYDHSGKPMKLPDLYLKPVVGRKAFIKYYYGSEVLGRALRGVKRMGDQNVRHFPNANLHRYHWLNLHGHFRQGAVEIRLHQGTTDPAMILNWMRMWHDVIEFFSSRSPVQKSQLGSLPSVEDVVPSECLAFYDGVKELLSAPVPDNPPVLDKVGLGETKVVLPAFSY